MAVRKYFSFVLLFALVVIADAYLFYTLYETTQSDEEDLLKAVWEDMVYFPVPQSSYDTKGYGVSFGLNAECASVSYPSFYKDLQSLYAK